MDKTEKYIKMCEKAEEIQSLLDKREDGNYLYVKKTQAVEISGKPWLYWLAKYGDGNPCQQWVSHYWESDSPSFYGQDVIWLPRQDQLQEMVEDEHSDPLVLLDQVLSNWLEVDDMEAPKFDSMEQLWLAFVMKERWNKVWNAEKWGESAKG